MRCDVDGDRCDAARGVKRDCARHVYLRGQALGDVDHSEARGEVESTAVGLAHGVHICEVEMAGIPYR